MPVLFVVSCANCANCANSASSKDTSEAKGRPNTVVMHPDFRMLVLANRPGFPFLGNDFFGALGKHTHARPAAGQVTSVLMRPQINKCGCWISREDQGQDSNCGRYRSWAVPRTLPELPSRISFEVKPISALTKTKTVVMH